MEAQKEATEDLTLKIGKPKWTRIELETSFAHMKDKLENRCVCRAAETPHHPLVSRFQDALATRGVNAVSA